MYMKHEFSRQYKKFHYYKHATLKLIQGTSTYIVHVNLGTNDIEVKKGFL